MIKNKSLCEFKKLIIEPKRKYVYLTFNNNKIIKVEKDRFTLDMSYNFACRCKEPKYGNFGTNSPYSCHNCGKHLS